MQEVDGNHQATQGDRAIKAEGNRDSKPEDRGRLEQCGTDESRREDIVASGIYLEEKKEESMRRLSIGRFFSDYKSARPRAGIFTVELMFRRVMSRKIDRRGGRSINQFSQ